MPTEQITIRIPKDKRDKVLKIAETLDCTYGRKGSIAQLLIALADNKVIVSKNLSKNT